MAKYMLTYRGPATPASEMTEDKVQEIMQAWGAWMGGLGERMVEAGSPFGGRATVRADGKPDEAADLTGYTVVEADDLDGAAALCDGHPFLSDGSDRFFVDIFELVEMSM